MHAILTMNHETVENKNQFRQKFTSIVSGDSRKPFHDDDDINLTVPVRLFVIFIVKVFILHAAPYYLTTITRFIQTENRFIDFY